jgi:acyl-CoA synthetase (AMP-forming)/AMP-acid ligase II
MARILADHAEVFTPYGATESLPVASIGSRQVLSQTRAQTESGAGVCVGRVVAPVRVEIIRISDQAIADWSGVTLCEPGEIGEICVHGPTTTQAYYGRPQATVAAKILRDGEVWHRMGDTGYFDADGLLWYCGRKGHRVETAEGTLHTAPVEEIFNTHPQVRRTALVGLAVGGRIEPLLCVEKAAGCALNDRQLFGELMTLGVGHPAMRGVRRFAVHPGFPVDIRHNAKIGREKLAEWAQGLRPVPSEMPGGAS